MNKESIINEDFLRRSLPVYINSYNQLTYLRDTVDWFFDNGFQNIKVFDNRSGYPALIEYFGSDAFTGKASLERLRRNIGPRSTLQGVTHKKKCGHPFIFTDPDLLLPSSPDPLMLTTMFELGKSIKF